MKSCPAPENKTFPFYLWIRVLIWCSVIILFSSIPNYDPIPLDLETSLGIIKFMCRKLAHLLEYGALMIFFYRALEQTFEKNQWHFVISLVFIVLFALTDEWHQSFVDGRSPSTTDVFIDAIGALIALRFIYEKKESKALS